MTTYPLAYPSPALNYGLVNLVRPALDVETIFFTQLDSATAAPGELQGIRPGSTYAPETLSSGTFGVAGFRLLALPVPWATDDAGIAYPAGVLWIYSQGANGTGYGYVVPDTLPVGFTARNDADDHRMASLVGPLNARFILDSSNTFVTGAVQGAFPTVEVHQFMAQLGMPVVDDYNDSELNDGARPQLSFWVGDALKRSTYQTLGYGWLTKKTSATTCEGSTTGAPLAGGEYPTGYNFSGPGWRNIRAQFITDAVIDDIGVTGAIDDITMRVYLDGVLFSTTVYTGPYTADSVIDATNIYPAAATAQALCEITFEITMSGTGGPGLSTGHVEFNVFLSPRIDIPLPWTVVGPNNECAPGGYLTGSLIDPPFAGPAPSHCAAGVTSVVLTPTIGDLTVYEAWCASFIPPTTGIWRIVSTLNSTAASIGKVTRGEHEFCLSPNSNILSLGGSLCRGGKRMFGAAIYASDLALTWTLTAIAQVQTAIPSGAGLTVNAGHLTDYGWFFGTIAIPAAGDYIITATYGATGLALDMTMLLCASETDAYAAEHQSDPCTISAIPTAGGTVVLRLTVSAGLTLYVRFGKIRGQGASNRVDNPSPQLLAAWPTITWAAA